MESSFSQGSAANRTRHEAPAAAWLTARRPILDVHNDVRSYELLLRRGNGSASSAKPNGALAHPDGLGPDGLGPDGLGPDGLGPDGLGLEAWGPDAISADAIHFVEKLVRGLRTFVPCTPGALVNDRVNGLPSHRTVIEIPADAEPTPDLLEACRTLKLAGYGLALDRFAGNAGVLAGLADYIGVDFAGGSASERQALLNAPAAAAATLVAKNVETQEQFLQAKTEGFDLFEGYYFLQPEPGAKQNLPGNKLVHLEILEMMQNDPFDLHRLSQLVSCDPDLTYRLLRLVNSPLAAIRQEVTSVQSALIMVGQNAFRRIATVAIVSDLNPDKPAEILRMALARGRFCELAAELCRQNPAEQYLIGMVSLFPTMLGTPMEKLASLLPLRPAVCDALCGRQVAEGALLQWVIAIEHGNWPACDEIAAREQIPQAALMQHYGESIAWGETSLTSMA